MRLHSRSYNRPNLKIQGSVIRLEVIWKSYFFLGGGSPCPPSILKTWEPWPEILKYGSQYFKSLLLHPNLISSVFPKALILFLSLFLYPFQGTICLCFSVPCRCFYSYLRQCFIIFRRFDINFDINCCRYFQHFQIFCSFHYLKFPDKSFSWFLRHLIAQRD